MGRKKQLFEKNASEPFKLSRSKIDLFLNCPRCFYLDRKLGISAPGSFPLTLNNAVDCLLKKEFDAYRCKKMPHPLMKTAGVNAVPLESDKLKGWQDFHNGLQYLDTKHNLLIYGAPDDVWVNADGEYIVADYKATSTDKEITLDDGWKIAYKRQVEIYQWLLKKNGFKVNDKAYFVYANALVNENNFNSQLKFDIKILGYDGNTDWIESKIEEIYQCLCSNTVPKASQCPMCNYTERVANI
ncbi:MAG: PD-(D/E)XK nuclease family protein [Patescibacteria group bacterium]